MTFLLLWSSKAAAIVAFGFVLTLALRRRSAATRNLVLRVALVAAWLVPLAALVAPQVEVALPTLALAPSKAPSVVGKTLSEPTPIQEGWSVVQPDPHDVSTLGFERQTAFSSAWVPAIAPLFLFWWGGTGLLVLRWLVGLRRLRRLRRGATPTDESDVWRAPIAVPATYGRTILMPRASEDWPETRVWAAILHERAHVARRDWHWQTLAALFVAIHWANPLAWLLARALRDTAEAAADDEALALMRPSDYARELLAVATSVGPTSPALAMARRGGVVDRVAAILADRERRRPTRLATALLFVSILGAGLAVAGIARTRANAVHLIDVSDASGRYWNREGDITSKRTDNVGYQGVEVPRGQRWIKVHLDLIDSPKNRGIKIEVPPPAETRSYGSADTEGHLVELLITAPKSLRQTDVRLGLAEGEWQNVPGSGTFQRSIKRVVEGERPQYIVSLDVPSQYRGEQVRVVARLRNGTEPKRIGSGTGLADASLQLHGRPQDLASTRLEHRPYRWTTLKNVPLRPNLVEPTPRNLRGVSLRPDEPNVRALSGGRTLEFVGLWDPEGDRRAWMPDGTPRPSPGSYDSSIKSGYMKQILVGFRLRGAATEPSLATRTREGKVVHPWWSWPAIVPTDGRLVWRRTYVAGDGTTTVDARLALDSFVPVATFGPGQAKAVVQPPLAYRTKVGRKALSISQIVVMTVKHPYDWNRFAYRLQPLDAQGAPLKAYDGDFETSTSQFHLSVERPERAVQWQLLRRPVETVSFDDVHLSPRS